MGVKEHLAQSGNINLIVKAKESGLSNNTISSIFKDHNINISPNEVDLLYKVIPELRKKAVPKKAIKAFTDLSTSVARSNMVELTA